MAKTAAQRQAEYRTRRNDGEGDIRLNMWVSGKAARALGRIAGHHGVTRRELLERLILDEETDITRQLSDNIDAPEWGDYFDIRRGDLPQG